MSALLKPVACNMAWDAPWLRGSVITELYLLSFFALAGEEVALDAWRTTVLTCLLGFPQQEAAAHAFATLLAADAIWSHWISHNTRAFYIWINVSNFATIHANNNTDVDIDENKNLAGPLESGGSEPPLLVSSPDILPWWQLASINCSLFGCLDPITVCPTDRRPQHGHHSTAMACPWHGEGE